MIPKDNTSCVSTGPLSEEDNHPVSSWPSVDEKAIQSLEGDRDEVNLDETSSSVNADIGRKIRSARIILGLTQKTLSKLMNITFQQVQKYEKGVNRISASMLWSLSNKLGIEINYFFPGVKATPGKVKEAKTAFNFDFDFIKKDKDSKNLIMLIKHFRNLKDPDLKKQVLQLVYSMSNLKK